MQGQFPKKKNAMQNYFLCRVKVALIYNSYPIVWINHFGAKPDEVDKFTNQL